MPVMTKNRQFALPFERVLYAIWQSPAWTHYLVALSSTLVVAQIRMSLNPVLQSRIQFIYFTIPIALSALVGGFWPGMLAIFISYCIGMYIITPTSQQYSTLPPLSSAAQVQTVVSLVFVWIFICVVCHLLRGVAFNLKAIALERDATKHNLAALLNRISDGFVAIDPSSRVVYENSAFRNYFGFGSQEVVGKRLEDLQLLNPDSEISALHRAVTSPSLGGVEHFAASKDQWYHIRTYPDTVGTSVFIQDITNRKRTEQARDRLVAQERKLRSDAEQANRMKDEFVATTSHELRTPLSTILGWSEILQQRNKQQEMVEGLAAIERSTRIQAQLIDDLLDMSRLATGRLKLDWSTVELNTVVNEVIRAQMPTARQKGIELDEVPFETEFLIRADPERLTQIFSNLISNAIKFTPSDGKVKARIWRNDESHVAVCIEDTGEGIDEKLIGSIFQRFRQGNSSAARKHGGLGLGLAIVKELVESHGGRIEVDSEGPGKGSKFTVYLSSISAQELLPQIDTSNGDRFVEPLTDLYVLIVEDDQGTQAVLEMLLTETGARVSVASSAAAAIQLMDQEQPDVLVSDIGMPEIDGYQFIKMVRDNYKTKSEPKIRALAVTAFATEADRQKAIAAGFDGFLAKPIDGTKLRAAISDLVRSR